MKKIGNPEFTLKMLVISHDCSRTGAPILLLRLLRLFINRGDIFIRNVLRRSGPLEAEFKEISEVFVHPKPFWAYSKSKSVLIKGFNYLLQPYRENRFRGRLKSIAVDCDLIFINTISNGDLLRECDNT